MRCEATASAGAPSACRIDPLRQAKDSNAKYGPNGDLVPGQLITYTITYENVGTGNAHGVYITDQLDPNLDASTLVRPGSDTFDASSRMITWNIGQLAPKGQTGSQGQVTFNIRLKNGLAGGTIVSNKAVVYFPSVPEMTPTNAAINVVQPLAAVPQEIETTYQLPVNIVLQGNDVSGTPLTYAIVNSPINGQLTGTPPNLTYTPAAGYTGPDRFSFKANNGTMDSRPADVQITVKTSAADKTPPAVRWTFPENNAVNVKKSNTPILTDGSGSAYAPIVAAGFSELIDPATVSTTTMRMVNRLGQAVSATVLYDGVGNQVLLQPRTPLMQGWQYTVTITKGIKDLAGNPLASDFQWSFVTGPVPVYLPLIWR